MDDLLIVRRSDRSKERFQQRRRSAPLALNLSLTLAIAVGFLTGSATPQFSDFNFLFGAVAGGLVGFAMTRFLGNSSSRQDRTRRPDLYDGLPFDNDDLNEAGPPTKNAPS